MGWLELLARLKAQTTTSSQKPKIAGQRSRSVSAVTTTSPTAGGFDPYNTAVTAAPTPVGTSVPVSPTYLLTQGGSDQTQISSNGKSGPSGAAANQVNVDPAVAHPSPKPGLTYYGTDNGNDYFQGADGKIYDSAGNDLGLTPNGIQHGEMTYTDASGNIVNISGKVLVQNGGESQANPGQMQGSLQERNTSGQGIAGGGAQNVGSQGNKPAFDLTYSIPGASGGSGSNGQVTATGAGIAGGGALNAGSSDTLATDLTQASPPVDLTSSIPQVSGGGGPNGTGATTISGTGATTISGTNTDKPAPQEVAKPTTTTNQTTAAAINTGYSEADYATDIYNQQLAQIGQFAEAGGQSILGLEAQEATTEGSMIASAASRGIKFEGSPLHQLMVQQQTSQQAIGSAAHDLIVSETEMSMARESQYNEAMSKISQNITDIDYSTEQGNINNWISAFSGSLGFATSLLGSNFWSPSGSGS